MLVGLSLLMNSNTVADLMGIAVGHVYFFLEDVFPKPRALGGLGGQRVLVTPRCIAWLFEGRARAADVQEEPDTDRVAPGGFAWGQGQPLGHN